MLWRLLFVGSDDSDGWANQHLLMSGRVSGSHVTWAMFDMKVVD